MTGNVTLKDLQPVIFKNITSMFEDLYQTQAARALTTRANLSSVPSTLAPTIEVAKTLPSKNRGVFHVNGAKRNPGVNRILTKMSTKYCRICHLAGSDARIYTSHEIGQCSRLSIQDLESIRSALVLNGMITLDIPEQELPACELQPGWDNEEASDPEHANQA